MKKAAEQERILVIRFHAFGDLVAILPYVNGLRQIHPSAQIDLLTAEALKTIPAQVNIFDRIIGVKAYMKPKLMFLWTLYALPSLRLSNYSNIIDLQGDRKSHLVSRVLMRKKLARFDKYGNLFAGLRYLKQVHAAGYPSSQANFNFTSNLLPIGKAKLLASDWDGKAILIALNPAGFFSSRNWPLPNYHKLIELLIQKLNSPFKVVFIGDHRIAEKARLLTAAHPDYCLNLVEKTTQLEAFSILPHLRFMISEDSALAHMAWSQGVKTCMMLGSTRADWTAPPYDHVISLTSSDLACGDCMLAHCKYGDVRCLTRYSPDFVFQKIAKWL